MWFEILGFDIYLDKKAKPWLIEANLSPSFATDTNLDDELKRGVITDSFKLLWVNHRERVRKINRKKEDMQKRIVERTSYKENLQKKKDELEKLKKKRENYEKKNMGNYKLVYPSPNEEKQTKYLEYLKASQWSLPFPVSKNTSAASKLGSSEKPNPVKAKVKAKITAESAKAKEALKKKNKSPYDVSVRRLVTPSSQKQRKRGHASNPKYM